MSNEMRKSLKERAREFSVQLPFMEGKEKGSGVELIAQHTTIRQFGFLPNEHGVWYAVFTVDEHPKKFFFGGQVLTDQLQKLEDEGYREEIELDGLPMLMTEKKSKTGRKYTAVEFYPEDEI